MVAALEMVTEVAPLLQESALPRGSVKVTPADNCVAPFGQLLVSPVDCQVPSALAAVAVPRQLTETDEIGKLAVKAGLGVKTNPAVPDRVAPAVGVVSCPGLPLATFRWKSRVPC